MQKIPYSKTDNYSKQIIEERQQFILEKTNAKLSNVGHYGFNPDVLPGNIENFIGVAQVPIGLAGPLKINGENAVGDFYVPMATTEGTLVASYNRGMKLTREAGGITTTVLDDAMQRTPLFIFENARGSKAFGKWVSTHFPNAFEPRAFSKIKSGVRCMASSRTVVVMPPASRVSFMPRL